MGDIARTRARHRAQIPMILNAPYPRLGRRRYSQTTAKWTTIPVCTVLVSLFLVADFADEGIVNLILRSYKRSQILIRNSSIYIEIMFIKQRLFIADLFKIMILLVCKLVDNIFILYIVVLFPWGCLF